MRTGLRNVSIKGERFGRPRAQVDASSIAALRSGGFSWARVCRTLNLSKGTAQRAFYAVGTTLPVSEPERQYM